MASTAVATIVSKFGTRVNVANPIKPLAITPSLLKLRLRCIHKNIVQNKFQNAAAQAERSARVTQDLNRFFTDADKEYIKDLLEQMILNLYCGCAGGALHYLTTINDICDRVAMIENITINRLRNEDVSDESAGSLANLPYDVRCIIATQLRREC